MEKYKYQTISFFLSFIVFLSSTIIGFVLLFGFLSSPVFAYSTTNIPLDSPLYEDIEILVTHGLIKSNLPSTKPFTRAEVGRLLAEAIENSKSDSKLASTESLLDRLAEEHKEKISEFIEPKSTPATYIKPLDRFTLRYQYLDGPSSLFNTEGINYFDGSNATATFQSRGRLWNYVSFYIQPIVTYCESFSNIDGNDETKLKLHKGYLKATFHNIELEAGRDSLWWGPGYHGALLISHNAKPFDMIKLSNPRSTLLPWIFGSLGPFKFNLFLSQLDKDAVAEYPPSHSKLMGLRFDFKPHPLLEVGASYLSHFGGERAGIESLDISDYLYIMFSNECRDFDKRDSNKQFAIDLSLTIPNVSKIVPIVESVKCYTEVGGEDDGYPPDRRAFLVGTTLYDIFGVNGLTLRAEYADLSPSRDDVRRAWYTHSVWPMRQDGRIFGHHAGTDSDDLFIELSQRFNNGFHYKVGFDKEGNGLSYEFTQQKYQYFCEAGYDIKKRSHLTIRYSYEDIDNCMNVKDSKKENHLWGIKFDYTY